jgi:hypothetical protein
MLPPVANSRQETIDPLMQQVPSQALAMTEEQKFVFDLKGWVLLPAIIERPIAEEIRAHIETLLLKPDALPANQRSSYSGPAEVLLDHPAVVAILREVLMAPDPNPDCYGFRCESSFPMYRKPGQDGLEAHGGTRTLNPVFSYNARNGKIYSGLTRVIWELNDVATGDGGTLIMSGSHKSEFSVPKSLSGKDSPLFESYACPAGSALVFSEALCHAGPVWNNKNHNRIGVFNCYNRVEQQFHKLTVPREVIDALSPKRRTLFRGVWAAEFHYPEPAKHNHYFNDSNRAL